MVKKIAKESVDIVGERLDKLKEFFPEVFSEGKVDFEKLHKVLGNFSAPSEERYFFNWVGRQKAFRLFQEKAKGTLIFDKEESVEPEKTENAFIEGDNLEVLKLLQKGYQNKIKMIYIDPPYNTGKDFVYKDNFKDSLKNYLEQTGQVDSNGNKMSTNTETNGRFHSDWLTMMYPRLFLARNLLNKNGVIFISIGNDEVHNLRKICDEIFGEDNLLTEGIVNKASEIADNFTISKHEYFLVYAKDKNHFSLGENKRYTVSRGTVGNVDQTMPIITFPAGLKCISIKDGTYKTTRKIEGSSENIENIDSIVVENGKLKTSVRMKAKWRSSNDMRNFFGNNCNPTPAKINGIIEEIYIEGDRFMPQIKKMITEKIPSMILDYKRGSKRLENLDMRGTFDNPKDPNFLKKLVEFSTGKNDLILDFFSGSATIADAIMQLNSQNNELHRKFICIQLPEKINENDIKQKPKIDSPLGLTPQLAAITLTN